VAQVERARLVRAVLQVHPAVARRVVDRKADLLEAQGRKAVQAQVAPAAQAAHPVRSHQGAVVRVAWDHQEAAHRAVVPLAVQEPKAARDLAARVAVARVGVDHRAAHRVGLAVNQVLVRSQVLNRDHNRDHSRDHSRGHKAAANRPAQAPDHRDRAAVFQVLAALAPAVQALAVSHPAAAMAAGLDQADPVPAQDQAVVQDLVPAVAVQVASVQVDQDQVVSVPVALAVQGNRMARAAIAVARRGAAAALVQPVVVAARVTTSGMDLAGWPLQYRTRASNRSGLLRSLAFVRTSRPLVQVRMSAKPCMQDVSQVCYE
jgi:hypothetical protein